jgi:hypothetical protein
MNPENKSGKRKAESGNFPQRKIGGAAVSFLAVILSLCRQTPPDILSFRFPLSAFRFCL